MSRFIPFCLLLSCLVSSSTVTAEIYVYRNQYGQLLFSDGKIDRAGFTFVKMVSSLAYVPRSVADRIMASRVDRSKNPDRFDHYIQEAAAHHDVDPALVKAVIHAESAFNRNAISRVGAQGLMQLMPRTAASYDVTDPYNPEQNIFAGTKHLKYLMRLFKNNVDLVLAAYNAGQANVYKYKGIPPFKETQKYVVKVKRLRGKYSGHI